MTFATAFVLLLLVASGSSAGAAHRRSQRAEGDDPSEHRKGGRAGRRPRQPFGNMGALIAQILTPDGPVEIDYLIAGDSTRGEVRGRLAAFPRGTIVLQHLHDDAIKVLNPENKTWYELPATARPRRADRRAGRADGTDRGDRDDRRPARGALSLRRNAAIPGTGRRQSAVRLSDEHRSVRRHLVDGRVLRRAATRRFFRRSRRRPPFPAWRR